MSSESHEPEPRDPLAGQLLELVYDLLPADEQAALRQRIESEPDVAAAFADAQRTAELLAAAARLPTPPVRLAPPSDPAAKSRPSAESVVPGIGDATRSVPAPSVKLPARFAPPGRMVRWIVGLAAAVLLIVTAGGYTAHRSRQVDVAADHLRLTVTGPANVRTGVANPFTVATTSVTGDPMAVDLQYAVYSPGGKTLLESKARTDDSGRLNLTIPSDVALGDGARLEVLAFHGGRAERGKLDLPAVGPRFVTRLSLDKPLYQPGETVYYRSLTLSRFGLDVSREMPIQFEIHDPSGAVVAESELEGVSERGVGGGAFPIPEELAGGEYQLVARSMDDSFPEEVRKFHVSRYRLPRLKKELEFTRDSYGPGDRVVADFAATRAEGGAAAQAALRITADVDGATVHQSAAQTTADGKSRVEFALPAQIETGDAQLVVAIDDGGTRETIAKTIPINLGKVDVRFFPEGGDLVAGLENRVYFTGRDPLGEPVHIAGQVVDSADREVTAFETTHKGMGSFKFTPAAGQEYALRVSSPADVKNRPKLPPADASRHVVLSSGADVVAAGQPAEAMIQSNQPGMPLVVAAYCRGVQVGQTALAARDGAQRVEISLTQEAQGVIRLTVFDYTNQPRPIAERLIFRRPEQRLQVRAAGHSERYSPGDPVQLSLMVTNEKGEPAPRAVVGVKVVDDSLLKLADDDQPTMTTGFWLTSEVEKPEDLEEADFYLSDDPKAPAALDLLLGTQGWRRFAEKTLEELRDKGELVQALPAPRSDGSPPDDFTRLVALDGETRPPAMLDNLRQARDDYAAHLAMYAGERKTALARLGMLSFFGGLGLAVTLALAGLLRLAAGPRFWAPSLGAALACLVVGLIWMNSDGAAQADVALTPFAEYRLALAEPVIESKSESGLSDLSAATATPAEPLPAPAAAVPADAPLPKAELAEDDRAKDAAQRFVDVDAIRGFVEPFEANLALEIAPNGRDFFRFRRQAGVEDRLRKMALDKKGLLREEAKRPMRARGAGGGAGKFDEFDVSLGDLRQLVERRKVALGGRQSLVRGEAEQVMELRLEQFRFTVREYAHQHLTGEPGVRGDFTETVYWHPLLVAGDDGRAEIQFALSDSITTFRVSADAHDGGGRIGDGGGEIISRIPFSLEPKAPLEVNAGDRIDLPVAVVNDTRAELPVTVALAADDLLKLEGPAERQLKLAAEERRRETFSLSVVGQAGRAAFQVRGAAGTLFDAKQQTIAVVPPGFPFAESYSGKLQGEQQVTVKLPQDWVPGSLEVTLTAFPSSLADLQRGLEGMLGEPTGCFEQASSVNYPNVLTLRYLEEHNIADPETTRRAKDLLKTGYARLSGYECRERGYEWFGGDPGHEALTAYGLLEFRDMAAVHEVDPQMIERTAKWLLDRRDRQGGFKRNDRALDTFGGAPAAITDAYIVWALSEAGQTGIERETIHAAGLAVKSDDPYQAALAAGAALNAGQEHVGKQLLDKLAAAQQADGRLDGKQGSITRSGGVSLAVETTALAALAWLKAPAYHEQANKAVEWIIKNRQGAGGFGSTQATILALKALMEHARANKKTTAAGELIVKRNDTVIGRQPFGAGHVNTIRVEGIAGKLEPGENKLTIRLDGENKMPYALDVSYRSHTPASHEACPLRLATRLESSQVRAGDTVALTAELDNTAAAGQPMTIAILGLPAGLQPRTDQLDELKKAGAIDYYETRAREVICYWRSLAPSAKVRLKLNLVAEWPGRYVGPASRAYLYYTAEQKQWAEPLSVEIKGE